MPLGAVHPIWTLPPFRGQVIQIAPDTATIVYRWFTNGADGPNGVTSTGSPGHPALTAHFSGGINRSAFPAGFPYDPPMVFGRPLFVGRLDSNLYA